MPITEPLRVMTFNVRQMDGDDGPQSWPYRKGLLAETVSLSHPHLLGAQEIFPEQTEFLLERFPEFDCFGQGRFGDNRDKHNKIFFDRSRFSLVDCGEYWFSRTPTVPGSSDWEIPRPRMVSWGRLREADGAEILMLNTHLPYGRGAVEARRESARLVLQLIDELPQDLTLFLTGDFNAAADGEIYALLTGELRDAWKTAQLTTGPEGTVHGFGTIVPTGRGAAGGRRIDWILHRHVAQTLSAETVTHTAGGLYPSDHYPVVATFLSGNGG